jgi:hypothetical protein
MGKGGGGTDEMQRGGGLKIEGEGGWDAWHVGRNLLTERGVAAVAIAVAVTATVRAAARKRASGFANMQRKETREIKTMLRRGGGRSP